MKLNTEDGSELVEPDAHVLEGALDRLGLPGNGFAILGESEQHYLQTSGSRADGYIIEYRDEEGHHSSVRGNIPHREMIAVFLAYRNHGQWKKLIEWRSGYSEGPVGDAGKVRRPKGHQLVIVLFLAIGLVSIGTGTYLAVSTAQFLKGAVEVPGTVVKMVRNKKNSYSPIVEYTDQTGHLRTLHSSLRSNPPSFYEGEKVVVLYDPSDADFPLSAKIRSFAELWFGAIFAFVFGTAFAGIACAHWLFLRR